MEGSTDFHRERKMSTELLIGSYPGKQVNPKSLRWIKRKTMIRSLFVKREREGN